MLINYPVLQLILRTIYHVWISFTLRYADEVSNGYEVLVQRNDYLIPTTVINVSTSKMQGIHHYCFEFFFYTFNIIWKYFGVWFAGLLELAN